MDRNTDQNGGFFFFQCIEDLPGKRAGSAQNTGLGDKRKQDRIEKPVDVLRRNGGKEAIAVADAERMGNIEGLAEQICGGLGPDPGLSGGAPGEKGHKGLVGRADQPQGSIAGTAILQPDHGGALRGFDIGIRQDQPEGFRFAQIPKNLGMKGMGEDEVRSAGQRGQQGGEQMGLVLDAETNRAVCGEIRTNKPVPDSDRQGPDLPDGRPVRCKEAVPVFKEVEDPSV